MCVCVHAHMHARAGVREERDTGIYTVALGSWLFKTELSNLVTGFGAGLQQSEGIKLKETLGQHCPGVQNEKEAGGQVTSGSWEAQPRYISSSRFRDL